MTRAPNARPLRWVILAWTIWVILLAVGTFWYANGKGLTRTLLFLAITLPILGVWLLAWKKSSKARGG